MARPQISRARPYTPKVGALAGRTFTSERQYRAALARRKGFRSLTAQERARRPVFTRAQELRLPPTGREARHRALEALSMMRREQVSLTRAAHLAGTTPNAMLRYAGTAIKKSARGRYVPKASDRLLRRMHFITTRGAITLDVTGSRTASKIAEYAAAVRDYLETGKTDRLLKFRHKSIRVGKVAYPFITDPRTLDRLGAAGVVSFEDLYATVT